MGIALNRGDFSPDQETSIGGMTVKNYGMYVNGEWIESASGETLTTTAFAKGCDARFFIETRATNVLVEGMTPKGESFLSGH
jgi:hypothetical protein